MNTVGIQLTLVAFLVVLNAGFVGSEIALISLREGQLARLQQASASGRALAKLARQPNRFLSTIQIGITLALTFVTLVFGELAPKRLAMQRAEAWGLLAARPMAGIAELATPAIWVLSHATDLIVRLFRGDPDVDRQAVTSEEALERLASMGHSRAPVFTDELDDADRTNSVLGLIGHTGTVGDRARPATALPESLDAVSALRELQTRRQQLAVVVSEHGGVEGIITVEDLVEELVGEIYDEHDRDVRAVVRHGGGVFLVPGSFPIHDLEDLGLPMTSEEVTTVGGLIIEHLGRIPEVGDRVEIDGAQLEVLSVRRRAAERVRIIVDQP